MTLSYYPWQQSQWEDLVDRLNSSTLPHALLLKGPRYLGKLHFAEAFAAFLLCERNSSSPTNSMCGECAGCHLVMAGSHPDLRLIEPEGSRQIKIEQIREIIEFANQTAQMRGYRVIIIHPAEAMNINSANALLKSLEEPGEKTMLLLVSHQPGSLLPTVRSRCQQLTFHLPDREVAEQWLATTEVQGNHALLLNIAGGSPVRVVDALTAEYLELRSAVAHTVNDLLMNRQSVISAAKVLSGSNPDTVLEILQNLLLDAVKYHRMADLPARSEDLSELLRTLNSLLGDTYLLKIMAIVTEEQRALVHGATPNVPLLMESVLAQLIHRDAS